MQSILVKLIFNQIYNKRTILCSIFIAIVILFFDFITGKEIKFPIYYLIPIGMAAWKNRKYTAYILAVLLPLAREVFHIPWNELESLPIELINALIGIFALLFYVYLIDKTALYTLDLDKKVKVLEGMLPICASCKRIKNENGEYVQLERYISDHSEATFSHGICEECAQKLYPKEYKEIIKQNKKYE